MRKFQSYIWNGPEILQLPNGEEKKSSAFLSYLFNGWPSYYFFLTPFAILQYKCKTRKITAHTKTDAKTAVSIYFKINRREKDFYFVCLQCNIRRLIHWHGHYVPKHNIFCFLRLWTYQQNLLFCVNCGCVSIIRVVTGSCHWFFW